MNKPQISLTQIATAAKALGFARVGFTPITPLERGSNALKAWLDKGYHGNMGYMAQHGERNEPQKMLEQVKGIIVVALPYNRDVVPIPTHADSLHGIVARYAQGADYHLVLKEKLAALSEAISNQLGCAVLSRACVDTAPLLEREIAEEAGVGFVAKSTMTLIPGVGTYTLLGELLIDIDLPASQPAETKCGECTTCLERCPTNAFVEPYVLDARKCISYLTIESKEPIPQELRKPIGNRIFGCDICQEVCPFNASPKSRPGDSALSPFKHLQFPALETLLNLRSGEYRRFVKGTALRRVTRAQLGRNAAIALGNSGSERAIPPLIHALTKNKSPLIRGHAAWALGQLDSRSSREALVESHENERDEFVLEEVRSALNHLHLNSPNPVKFPLPN